MIVNLAGCVSPTRRVSLVALCPWLGASHQPDESRWSHSVPGWVGLTNQTSLVGRTLSLALFFSSLPFSLLHFLCLLFSTSALLLLRLRVLSLSLSLSLSLPLSLCLSLSLCLWWPFFWCMPHTVQLLAFFYIYKCNRDE